jgi:hypothetical protein
MPCRRAGKAVFPPLIQAKYDSLLACFHSCAEASVASSTAFYLCLSIPSHASRQKAPGVDKSQFMRENEPVLLVPTIYDGKMILEKGEIL